MKTYSSFYITFAVINHVYGNGKFNESCPARCIQLRTHTKEYTTTFPITETQYHGKNLVLIFYLKGVRDASILLFPQDEPTKLQQTYEIILTNSSSEIRSDNVPKRTRYKCNILSSVEWRPFWIGISSDGLIQVAAGIGSSPFMSWKHDKPVPINYFGFSSCGSTEVNWAFRCPKNHSPNFTECAKLKTTEYRYDLNNSIDDYIQDDKTVFIPFYVKGESEANILLSPTSKPPETYEPAYEIVLKPGFNTWSAIRYPRGFFSEKVKHTENFIISGKEWRPFWIRISPNGLIEVGKEIGSPAFMSWNNGPPKIKNYAVASYHDGMVDWAIECPKKKLGK